MTMIIRIGIFFLNIIYFFIKLFPTNKNKICFISRQSNSKSLDMKLLEKELKKDKEIKLVFLCKKLDKGVINKIKYIMHMFKQMYHIATSKVVILDTYCIAISVLKHKKSLKVIQMWHALGSLKKFGYAALDESTTNFKNIQKNEKRNKNISKLMKMHKNYDYVLTSSIASKENFRKAFNVKDENMVILNLPRVDFLQDKKAKSEIIKKFYKEYPNLSKSKKIILYIPTFRKGKKLPIESIKNSVDYSKYILIIKLHNGQNEIIYNKNKIYKKNVFAGIELLHVADYVITDYSAIIYEAAIAKKPIYLYNYDYDDYINDRGFFINYNKELPAIINKDINIIIKKIENNIIYNQSKEEKFVEKYINNYKCNNTEKFAKFIMEIMRLSK